MEDLNLSKVERDTNPKLGNGLVASIDLDPGVAIIRISDPYIITVENGALNRVCSFCFIEAGALRKCSGCKIDRYCSKKCQEASWHKIHKLECATLKKLPGIPPTPVRALMQVLLKRNSATANPRWAGLEAHQNELMQHRRWDEILLEAKAASTYVPGWSDKLEIAVAVTCRIATNAFRTTLWDDTPVGLCFEPILALANHSCVPNAAITFDERCVQLRCLDFIKKGEQIFISYIDHTQRRDTRRAELQDRYFFRCNCEKCTNDDNPYATLQKSKLDSSPRLNLLCNINAVKAHIDACIAHTTSPTISQELASLTAVLPQVGALLECSKAVTSKSERLYLLKNALSSLQPLQKHQLYAISPYPTVLHELYLFFLDNALFIPALTMLIFIFLNCDMYNYPQPHHPVRVLRLFTIAKILKHIASLSSDDFEENVHGTGIEKEVVCAVDWISAFQATLIMAAGLASRSHGENSRFKAEVEGELREVMEVQRLRGDVGDKLMLWGREEHEVEGREYARKLFEGLRALGGCAFAVSETTTV